jgi:branched-chain amino acid transport system substrate-binding protein
LRCPRGFLRRLTSLCVLMSAVFCRAAPQSETFAMPLHRPILLGQIGSLTGNNPGGRDNVQGAALAVTQVNAQGGLLGHRPLQVLVEDDQTQAPGAIAAFNRLMQRHPSAIVGTSFSNASLAVIPSAEEAHIAYVSTGAADAQVEPTRPYVFMTPLTGQLVAEQLLRYLQFKGVKRLAVIYDADSQFARNGWTKQRSMLARYGIELATEQAVKVNTTDFAPALQAAAGSGAQAIMGWVTGPPAVGLVRSHESTARSLPLYLSHGAASPALIAAVGQASEGVTVATALAAVASQLPDSAVRQAALGMTDAFEKAYGHEPSQFALDGYVAVRLIAAAIQQAGDDRPEAIQRALNHLNLVTPQGKYQFSDRDHSGLRVDDVAITQIEGGHFKLTEWSRRLLTLGDVRTCAYPQERRL